MRRLLFIVGLLICGIATATAQQRPLITEDVDIIPPGSIRIQAGIDFHRLHDRAGALELVTGDPQLPGFRARLAHAFHIAGAP